MVEHGAIMGHRQEPLPERETAPTIRSAQHPWIKRMGAILSGADREAIVLEGDRLVDDALRTGVACEVALVSDERESRARELEALGVPVARIAAELLARKSALRNSPGIAAICRVPAIRQLAELKLPPGALVLAIAGVSDPGNLGALARSAEAAGACALLIVAGGASPWNDKALRGSMGSLLRLPVCTCSTVEEAGASLRALGFRSVAAATRAGVDVANFDWSGKLALWVGPETGLDPRALASFERISIPMAGAVESLNVTVAAALLLFAAGRNRSPKP
jgi:TrmH family RNA methyltransferase